MTSEITPDKDAIIDLDADQVVEDVAKPAATAATAPNPKSSGKGGWLLAGAALIVGAFGGGWLYKDTLSAYYPTNQMITMAEKFTAVESSNATLRQQVAALEKLSAQLASDLDALEAKEATLSGLAEAAQQAQNTTAEKLAALEGSLAENKKTMAALLARPQVMGDGSTTPVDAAIISRLQARIDSLEKDVASLKTAPAEAADATAALSQSLSDLKAKIAGGTGYRDEYERVARMVPAASGLDVLQQHAALGLPDAKALGAELKGLIASLPKPIIPGPVPESEGWWAGIFNSLSDLVTIRVEGDVDWPTAASAAAALADAGDLPQALDQLKAIEGSKPQDIQRWLDRAAARIDVENALQSVEEAVLRVIAAKG